MDRQTVMGFILIFMILMVWMWMNTPPPPPPGSEPTTVERLDTNKTPATQPTPVQVQPSHGPEQFGSFYAGKDAGHERIVTIETDLYTAKLSSKGGVVREWVFKKYDTWDGHPVQLVDYDHKGDFSLLFGTTDGRLINTKDLYFDVGFSPWSRIELSGDQVHEVTFTLRATTGGEIVKVFRFRNGEYGFDADVQLKNMGQVIANYEYQLVWESGLRYAEFNSIDESSFATAYAYSGGELTELDAQNAAEPVKKDMSGVVDWVSIRTKYFALAIMPRSSVSEGAYLEGRHIPLPDQGAYERYSVALKMPFKGSRLEVDSFRVFLGPVEYDILKSYGKDLEQIMSLGWAFIRPISTYILLPLLKFLNSFIPNWGVVIIIFSIIIKIALHPLTKTSMKSMKKMQALQPMMEEIRTKHKDDPQKMNSAIMNLYKEYGVNPAGGCLPILLQFPILFALFNVFRSAIELRQSEFVWWIQDLSVPDSIITLPFTVPIFGMNEVSGLALAMGITMFIQQKMTVKDPRQKAMVWMMPILMTLFFNGLPSGLNLYYFMFNLLSIAQQWFVNKQHGEEPLRKVEPKKKSQGGIFGKYTKDLPRFKR